MHSAQGPSQRQLRVGEQIRQTLAEILQRGNFDHPILLDHASEITVTEVRPSPDLKNATAYIIGLGGHSAEHFLPALNESTSYFQKEINNKLKLKFTPRLKFVYDNSYDQGTRIDNILSTISYADED
ncbi:MAG: 30S ribosome-binding factor RbfA [Alphaproteobacteria bacterium]|jgi:ribosome-binding factor A|nr:30S ribosome-binding factor RbfA [Alphaproteobacteria bacterium]MDP7222573.1 30S ribosome-binding factor RbfA [Alphaproteobacteria bacterium]